MSLDAVPSEMDWSEALDLVHVLRSDPSSQLTASLEGLAYPLDRVGWILSDLVDIQGRKAWGKKWTPYPRPIKPPESKQHWGNTAGRTRAEVVEILNSLGHNLPV